VFYIINYYWRIVMAANDYLPQKEGDLTPWTENFIAVANANLATLGLVAADISAITTKKSDYALALNNAISLAASAKAATEKKNFVRDYLKDNIRLLTRQIQARPGVPDSLKVQLGIKTMDPTPAPSGPQIPTELSLEIIAGGQIYLKWNRNGNPQNTIFIIEASPSVGSGFVMIDTTTKSFLTTSHREPAGETYFRVKAKRGDAVSEPGNVVVYK
jgi:hypothetical protein